MKKKICDFVYLDTETYISLESLQVFYWGIIIIPFMMVVMGIEGESLFPLISIGVWSLLFWIFVLILQSNRVRKTFELRFLVNGITGFLISSLFWILYTGIHLASDAQFLTFDYFLWILFFYVLFTVIYIALIVFGIYKEIYSKRKVARTLTGLLAAIFPGAGVSGLYIARLLRAHTSVSTQTTVATIGFVLLIFLPGLAHINFVKYYYCKKYGITCDEYGNATSPKLERKSKKKKTHLEKKTLPLYLKVLIGIACIPVIVFLILLIIGIIINL